MINYAMRRCLIPRPAATQPDLLTGLAWAFDGQQVIDEETVDYSLVCDFGGLTAWTAVNNPGSSSGPGNPPGAKLARSYNGTTQYHSSSAADLASYKYPATAAWVESKWIYPTSAASNRAIVGLCNGGADSTVNVAWLYRLKTDLSIDFVFNNNGTLKTLNSGAALVNINAWNSILCYDDGAGNVYLSINGGTPATTTRTSYAAHAGLTTTYIGYVDAVPYAGRICQFQRWHNRYFTFDSSEGAAIATGTGKLYSEMT